MISRNFVMPQYLLTSSHYQSLRDDKYESIDLKNEEEREKEKREKKLERGRKAATKYRNKQRATVESLERDRKILQQRNNQLRFRSNVIKKETERFIDIAQSLINGHSCFSDFNNSFGQKLDVLRERLRIPVYDIYDQHQQMNQQNSSGINSSIFFPPQSLFLSLPNRNVANFVEQLQYPQQQQQHQQLTGLDFNINGIVSSGALLVENELSFDSPVTPILEEQNKCESKQPRQRPTGLTNKLTWSEPSSTESLNDGKPQFDKFFKDNFPPEYEREMKKYAELKLQ